LLEDGIVTLTVTLGLLTVSAGRLTFVALITRVSGCVVILVKIYATFNEISRVLVKLVDSLDRRED